MKKYLLLVFTLFISILEIKAQDVASTQFFANPMYLNPAFAGTTKGARFGGVYRNQWMNVPSKFVTYNAWGDIYNPLFHGGLGFIAMQDVSGEGFMKTTTLGIIQSYERAIPKIIRIRAGYTIGMISKRLDWSKLTFSDQLDAVQGDIYPTKALQGPNNGRTVLNLDAGFMIDAPKFTLGNSQITNTLGYVMNHLTQPEDGLSGGTKSFMPRKNTLHYTMVISISDANPNERSLYISPNFIYEQQKQFRTYNWGIYVTKDPLIAGMFYRKRMVLDYKNSDAFIVYLGLKTDFSKHAALRIGYSYDLTISGLASNTYGSHEISLSLEFKDKKMFSNNRKLKNRNRRATQCEDFGSKSLLF